MSNMPRTTLILGSGRIRCLQCTARSKRTGDQCRAPAMRGKQVCQFHGGKSTGPRTPAGLARCVGAHTTHGEETRAKRAEHRAFSARFKELQVLARRIGLLKGNRGRR